MKYFVVLSALCVAAFGLPHGNKIVGGSDVNIEEFPYMVSLLLSERYVCGGVILNQYNILTAAHCTLGRDHTRMTVQVGNNRLGLGESHDIWYIIEHPEYDPKTMDNDVAVVRLYEPLTFSAKVNQATLVTQGWEIRPGTLADIVGWGIQYETNTVLSEYLQATYTYVLSHEDCVAYYRGEREIGESMICGLARDHDVCHGDDGGPMLVNGYLIGIVSWGASCATSGRPAVFSKISANYDWIRANM